MHRSYYTLLVLLFCLLLTTGCGKNIPKPNALTYLEPDETILYQFLPGDPKRRYSIVVYGHSAFLEPEDISDIQIITLKRISFWLFDVIEALHMAQYPEGVWNNTIATRVLITQDFLLENKYPKTSAENVIPNR